MEASPTREGRVTRRSPWPAVGAALFSLLALLLAAVLPAVAFPLFLLVAALLAVGSTAYLVLRTDPAWAFTGALACSVFAGNWEAFLGLPGPLGPERLLLAAGIVGLAMKWWSDPDNFPRLRLEPVHWVLLLAVALAGTSALVSGTLFERESAIRLAERFGAIPFLVFALAPLVFRTARQRAILLGALVALGAYLGVIAFLETAGPQALVFPRYIVDPAYGYQSTRAGGPFAEAVTNGVGLYVCGVAASIAVITWRGQPARLAAAAVLLMCALGLLFTLQRSIWLGSIVATAVALLSVRELRRYFVPVAVLGALVVVAALAVVPGLQDRAEARTEANRSVWDRRNLNTAAVAMIAGKPLTGAGWDRFQAESKEYFSLGATYPLTAGDEIVHNVFLSHASELGLIGAALWAAGLLLAVGGAVAARAPPELEAWRIGLIAVASFWLIVTNFVYPQVFPMLALWLWIGVVWTGRSSRDGEHVETNRPRPKVGRPLDAASR